MSTSKKRSSYNYTFWATVAVMCACRKWKKPTTNQSQEWCLWHQRACLLSHCIKLADKNLKGTGSISSLCNIGEGCFGYKPYNPQGPQGSSAGFWTLYRASTDSTSTSPFLAFADTMPTADAVWPPQHYFVRRLPDKNHNLWLVNLSSFHLNFFVLHRVRIAMFRTFLRQIKITYIVAGATWTEQCMSPSR